MNNRTRSSISSFASRAKTAGIRLGLGLLLCATARRAHAAFTFDDIATWVGVGTNRAALVLDWNDGIHPVSLAWGYRWNGTASGFDMVEAVAAADPRLSVYYVDQGFGLTIFGVGYDVDNDGGAFFPGTPGFDTETGYADDADDHYEEGWYTQYWQYFTAADAPFAGGTWNASGTGFQTRQLHDGAWDGWRISPVVYPPPTTNTPPAPCAAAAPSARRPRLPVRGFAFGEIEHWTGSGSNRAALVVDWHDGTRPHALAWGYRWDGTASSLDMWQAITNADSALQATLVPTPEGHRIATCGYQRPSRHGDILPGTSAHDVRHTAFAWDHPASTAPDVAWSYWTLDYTDTYHPSILTATQAGMESRRLADGAWDAWSRGTETVHRPPGRPAAALGYPYAAEVIAYTPGSGVGYDWITGDLFTNAATALGRPTVDTMGDGSAIALAEIVPTVPVYPAFRAYEVVSIGAGGELIVAFEHPVYDNPANPYGADLIVFGNSNQQMKNGQEWTNGNPSNTVVSATCTEERGNVSVSQDGVQWHTFTNGFHADGFMPTLGRVYDPAAADTTLGPQNQWWGHATDPTLPPDPAIVPADWEDMNVADIARRYRGSAGGRAFDLAAVEVPACPTTGMKWIRFVRIEPSGSTTPEVDAMADVAPGQPYTVWQARHFDWLDDPAHEADTADPDADQVPNLLEYGLGRNPTNACLEPAFMIGLNATSTPPAMEVQYTLAADAPDVCLEVLRTASLREPDWRTNGIPASVMTGDAVSNVIPLVTTIPVDTESAFIHLRIRHDP